MQGIAYILRPKDHEPDIVNFDQAPRIEFIRGIVGDNPQRVPGWEHYRERRCVAFCGRDGRRDPTDFNPLATRLWHHNTDADLSMHDYLAGPVIVFTGDYDFLRAL
jgi:hypothetical protein